LRSLEEVLKDRLKGRVTLVGVGNTWKADDGAGAVLISRLRGKVRANLIEVGEVPESYLGRIEETSPQTLMFLDAADIGAAPGEMAIVEEEQLREVGFSTHRLSLALLMKYLKDSTAADVFLLAIQPKRIAFAERMSPEVEQAVEALDEILQRVIPAT
jgi:hydrogenase 3 maturation protease